MNRNVMTSSLSATCTGLHHDFRTFRPAMSRVLVHCGAGAAVAAITVYAGEVGTGASRAPPVWRATSVPPAPPAQPGRNGARRHERVPVRDRARFPLPGPPGRAERDTGPELLRRTAAPVRGGDRG